MNKSRASYHVSTQDRPVFVSDLTSEDFDDVFELMREDHDRWSLEGNLRVHSVGRGKMNDNFVAVIQYDGVNITPIKDVTQVTVIEDVPWVNTPSGPCEIKKGWWVTRCITGHTHVIPRQF